MFAALYLFIRLVAPRKADVSFLEEASESAMEDKEPAERKGTPREVRSFILRIWRYRRGDEADPKDDWYGEIEPVAGASGRHTFKGLDHVPDRLRELL